MNIYFHHRLMISVIIYGLMYWFYSDPNIIPEIILTIVFGILAADAVLSVVSMLRPMASYLRIVVCNHLWMIKYKPEKSYLFGLRTYSILDVIFWVPIGIITHVAGFSVVPYFIIVGFVFTQVFAVLLDVIIMNNDGYLYG